MRNWLGLRLSDISLWKLVTFVPISISLPAELVVKAVGVWNRQGGIGGQKQEQVPDQSGSYDQENLDLPNMTKYDQESQNR